ncbi:DUF6261 family protein [Epilithonimonas arachidiradicis]|uniref:Uncharacterized protein n=1 Tax=Epilithonimonas arachidiradicis TaxID=1617282 RepID=A0A420CXP7_9FLAO|nr:DUF6261 family protein [Epilithonimonas arachidiradicis]RKE83243.1 hypothetical protein BXY58_2797 [Epilithonimonas arachidiradicis]GGG65924.1 hypothetical protein GCM10007332_30690 [Epilithonimonas arachidiradicis]
MINSIDITRLRNANYLQFQKDFLEIISRNNPAVLQIETKYDELSAKTNELESLFKKVLANPISQELLVLDERRDSAVNGIYYIALGYSYHYDTNLKQAAEALLANIKLYGSGIARLNYQAETATINSLMNDWDNKPELSQAIDTLGLKSWKDELGNINTEFSTRYLDRTQDYGNATPETLKIKREETNTVYYALRDRINALHLLVETPTSPYNTVINQLNALIEQYNLLLTVPDENGETPTS